MFETTVLQQKPESIKLLKEGRVGARLVTYKNGMQAVMKVAAEVTTKKNRRFQEGLPTKTFPQREVAFYKLSTVLKAYDSKFDVVPETVLGNFEGYPASFQQYVTAAKLYDIDPRLRFPKEKTKWTIALRETLRDKFSFADTLALTVLDFLACSRDRHAGNYGARLAIVSGKALWRLIGWDNGCSFGLTQAKYQCVAHKHLFRFAFDMSSIVDTIHNVKRSELRSALVGLISEEEIDHVWMRLQFLNVFPHRMPWATLSGGSDDRETFPNYALLFKPMVEETQPLYILNSQIQ